MVYRNTYFSDYLVHLFEQLHACNSNLSLIFIFYVEKVIPALPSANYVQWFSIDSK